MKLRWICLFGASLLFAGTALQAESTNTTTDDLPLKIKAQRLEYVGNMMVASGNVEIKYQNSLLKADHVSVDQQSGECHAEGNVFLKRNSMEWRGEKINYNFRTQKGDFGAFQMSAGVYQINAQEANRISEDELLLKKVILTPCRSEGGESPPISLHARKAKVIDKRTIKAWGVSFYLKSVPVFYLPYIERSLDASIFHVVLGESGNWGPYIQTTTTFNLSSNLVSKSSLDYLSRRGLGLGQDFKWKSKNDHWSLKSYYISDDEPRDSDEPDDYLNDNERWAIRTRYTNRRTERQYLMSRINWLSDPDVLEDFFNEDYRIEVQPENFLGFASSGYGYTLGLRFDKLLNDFYAGVDRTPTFSINSYTKRIAETPFYYHSSSEAAYLEQQFADGDPRDRYRSWRIDTDQTIKCPLKFDWLNFIPRAKYRATYYSQTPTNQTKNLRHIFEVGAETSFKAYKVLSDKPAFYGNGLRHLAQPFLDYTYSPQSSLETNEIYQFDRIDELTEQHGLRFGIRNELQTRRNNGIYELLELDLHTFYRFDPARGQQDFGNLHLDSEIHLSEQMDFYADLEYDWHTHLLSPLNMRFAYQLADDTRISGEYRYRQNEHDLISGRLELFPNRDWSFDLVSRYDKETSRWEENQISVKRRFNCLGLGLGYKQTEWDHQIWFYLWGLDFPASELNLGT